MRKLILFAIVLCASLAIAQGPPYPYNVNLAFTASTSTVTGYNMYRAPYVGSACGAFVKLNTATFTGTTYTDPNPPQGAYCYAATSVCVGSTCPQGGTGESGLSNVDSNIAIPPAPPTGLGETVAGNDVTFKWKQSVGAAITSDSVWCAPSQGSKYSDVWTSTRPAVSAMIRLSKGSHYCIATAAAGKEVSGPSNQVVAEVK